MSSHDRCPWFLKWLPRPSLLFTFLVTIPHLLAWCTYVLCRAWSDKALAMKIKKKWCVRSVAIHEIKVAHRGTFKGDPSDLKGMIIVSNHQSIVDIMVTMSEFSAETSFLAKKELSLFPIFGWAARLCGTFFIDRSRGTQNEELGLLRAHLARGGNIFIFPEGTRSADGRLLPFKRGAFVLAIQNQVPVVPVTLIGTREICPKKSLAIGSGEVTMFVDEPITTTGLGSMDRFELSEKVRGIIEENLKSS